MDPFGSERNVGCLIRIRARSEAFKGLLSKLKYLKQNIAESAEDRKHCKQAAIADRVDLHAVSFETLGAPDQVRALSWRKSRVVSAPVRAGIALAAACSVRTPPRSRWETRPASSKHTRHH